MNTNIRKIMTFGVNSTAVFHEFINLYDDDNLILNDEDECFFLLTNLVDYHLPIVCRGIVRSFEFSEGMSKNYYIEFQEFMDPYDVVKPSLINKHYYVYSFKHGELVKQSRRLTYLTDNSFKPEYFNLRVHNKRVFCINSFFVRGFRTNDEKHKMEQLENIKKFRAEYLEYIYKDHVEQTAKMEYMLNQPDVKCHLQTI